MNYVYLQVKSQNFISGGPSPKKEDNMYHEERYSLERPFSTWEEWSKILRLNGMWVI